MSGKDVIIGTDPPPPPPPGDGLRTVTVQKSRITSITLNIDSGLTPAEEAHEYAQAVKVINRYNGGE